MKPMPPTDRLPLAVGVLLGGESSRFGSPKAFLDYQGKSLASHLLGSAASFAEEVVAVGRHPDQVPPDAKAFPYAQDQWEEKGPLSGLQAALSAAHSQALFLCAVDMPFLRREVVDGLRAIWEREGRPDAVVPLIEGRWQPLCALWSKTALKALEAGWWRSLQQLLFSGTLRVREVPEEELRTWDKELGCLRNFNTWEEWNSFSKGLEVKADFILSPD